MDVCPMTDNQLRRVWQKETTRTWRELARRFALPVPVPRHVRKIVERDFAEEVTEASRTSEGEVALEELLTDYGKRAEEEFLEFLRGLVGYVQTLGEKGLLDSKEDGHGSGTDGSGSAPQAAGGAEEFRLRHRRRLLEFVAHREVPLIHLLEGRFDTGGRPILWKDLAREWKRAHSKDPLKPDTLRRYYHRARTDPRVCEPFIRDLRRLWAEWAERLDMLQGLGARKEDIFMRFTGPIPVHPDLAPALNVPPGTLVGEEVYSAKYPPEVAAALRSAARAKCMWTARIFAFPRDVRFCARRDCRGCRVLRALRKPGFLQVPRHALRDPEQLAAWREDEVRRFREQFVPRAQ